jgi:hypothetical protein
LEHLEHRRMVMVFQENPYKTRVEHLEHLEHQKCGMGESISEDDIYGAVQQKRNSCGTLLYTGVPGVPHVPYTYKPRSGAALTLLDMEQHEKNQMFQVFHL